MNATETDNDLMGLAPLMTMAINRVDLTTLGHKLLERAQAAETPSANALMDLSVLLQFFNSRELALGMQEQALKLKQIYKLPAKGKPAIRLLAIKCPGDVSANTPLEFLVEDSDIELTVLYVAHNLPFKQELPEHDVMFVAIGESEQSLPLLRLVANLIPVWPTPVLNHPDKIARLSRDSASSLLHSTPGVVMPPSIRMDRPGLERVARGEDVVEFPIIVRPVDSHAGKGLIKADNPSVILEYLQTASAPEFYISRFVDYSGEDGLFRKYRVVLIDGRPYASHMAISEHWMIHYLNGGMDESPEKREEEASFMAGFDENFAARHREALSGIAERIGLEYLIIDCAETQDGQLLVFEVDSSAVVHAMDSPELYPYKKPQMRKVFEAFRAMLMKAIAAPQSGF